MRRLHTQIIACLTLCMLAFTPVAAQALEPSSQQDIIRATLVSETSAIEPGKPLRVGLLLEAQKGWHTYWENPGDAGLPTSMKWTLPEGFSAGAIKWPAPERVKEGDLVTHSYHDTVFLPVTITVPNALPADGKYTLEVKANWLVCKDICIPETADVAITLPVTENPAPSAQASLFTEYDANAVTPFPGNVTYALTDGQLTLVLPLSSLPEKVRTATFFPRQYNAFDYAAPQDMSQDASLLYLAIRRTNDEPQNGSSGIISITFDDGSQKHYDIKLQQGSLPSVTAGASDNQTQDIAFASLLLLAIAGGLILNLMPCVLPVLSLKALAIAKKAGEAPAQVKKLGLAYTLGVLASFLVIAGILIALRESGEAIGWGYQMQSPAFSGFLIYLLFLVGLNLSGVFDLPVLFGNSATRSNEHSAIGSFYTGVLATAVATPCTAPFMATAIGAALTMPTAQALLIFEALGLGLALPFLLISFFPALLRFLPKPGVWMERFRQLLAFPMYASVIWLLWVLVLQTGADGLVVILGGMLVLGFVIWLKAFFEIQSLAYRIISIGALLATLAFTLPMLEHMQDMAAKNTSHNQSANEQAYSKQALDQLRSQGKPVFLNATAAWCITCQVNARIAIHTQATEALFTAKDITYMVADWTRPNPEITELLSSFGYKGVPLYVYYPPKGGKPEVLPQLLTESIIENVINPRP
jgi:thiol:disulfide interchange protein/DsbC/DsbD-like thiol-disulfide interchange protein